jgi:hypothetical protein
MPWTSGRLDNWTAASRTCLCGYNNRRCLPLSDQDETLDSPVSTIPFLRVVDSLTFTPVAPSPLLALAFTRHSLIQALWGVGNKYSQDVVPREHADRREELWLSVLILLLHRTGARHRRCESLHTDGTRAELGPGRLSDGCRHRKWCLPACDAASLSSGRLRVGNRTLTRPSGHRSDRPSVSPSC